MENSLFPLPCLSLLSLSDLSVIQHPRGSHLNQQGLCCSTTPWAVPLPGWPLHIVSPGARQVLRALRGLYAQLAPPAPLEGGAIMTHLLERRQLRPREVQ